MPLSFQPRWHAAILAGAKTTTVRTKRLAEEGETFEIDGVAFRVTRVESMPLGRARDSLWREEGMASPEEFGRAWIENHPTRGFRASDSVWVHRFSRA